MLTYVLYTLAISWAIGSLWAMVYMALDMCDTTEVEAFNALVNHAAAR